MTLPKSISIIFLLLFLNNVRGQNPNLIPNPGFENYSACPTSFSQINFAAPWQDPFGQNSTSDLMHLCASFANSFTFFPGPHTGQGYGMFVSNFNDNGSSVFMYEEYIQVPLNQPLIAGVTYEISFYAGLITTSSSSANCLGVLFTDNSVFSATYPTVMSMEATYNSSIPQFTVTNVGSWQYYQAVYVAQGGETQMVLGNFSHPNTLTVSTITAPPSGPNSYYIGTVVDDVRLISLDSCAFQINNSYNSNASFLQLCEGDSVHISYSSFDSTFVPTWNNSFVSSSFYTDTSGVYIASNTTPGCSFYDTLEIEFVSVPDMDLTDTTYCFGDTIQVINPDTNFSASLYNGQMLLASGDTVSVYFNGNYTYRLQQGYCVLYDFFNASLLNPPSVQLPADTLYCDGVPYIFEGETFLATNFSWNTGSDSSAVLIDDTGSYILQVNNHCGTDADTMQVNTYQVDYTLNFSGDTLICNDSPLEIWITGNDLSALWNDGQDTLHKWLGEGTWTVTIADSVCSHIENFQIFYPHSFNLGIDTLMCDDELLYLSVSESWVDSLKWSDGSTGSSFATDAPGLYWVGLYEEYCLVSDTLEMTKLYTPDLSYADTNLCTNDYFALTLNDSYAYRVNGEDITIPYLIQESGFYSIEASNYCGTGYASFLVNEIDCSCNVFIPNTFSPNGDEDNQRWKPSSICVFNRYELSVYNRWGELIFRTNDPNDSWDGTFKGKNVETGVYIYTLYYTTEDEWEDQLKGHINVIR